jgi:hypothetical protein
MKELDGFSHLLRREQDSLYSRSQADGGVIGSKTMDDEAESMDTFVMQLHTMLHTMHQEVEQKLERARNGFKREYNQHVVQEASRRNTYESGISDLSISPNSRYNLLLSTSPTYSARSRSPNRRPASLARTDNPSPTIEIRQGPRRCQRSLSTMSSPFLDSSLPTTCPDTEANTAATTPMTASPNYIPDTCTRPPSIRMPPAAADWSLFCSDAQVICKGWLKAWSCKISQRRRMKDYGLSLRAERADGLYLHHDLPATGITIPHTSHTGANPSAKNVVTFKEPDGHKLRKVTGHEEVSEKGPRYILQNAADHRAFQELIYGCDLEGSWDIMSVKSDREKESVTQTLRLWRDAHTQRLFILFYTNVRARAGKTYIHEPSKPLLRSLNSTLLTPVVKKPPSKMS